MSDTARLDTRPSATPARRHSAAGRASDRDGGDMTDKVADEVDDVVDGNPEIELLTRLGWIAKGIVYALMGLTAISIARQQPTQDEASPSGALAKVIDQPGGRFLLAVVAAGLLLYAVWRLLSVAVIRGHDASAWAHRVGYTCSAAFYLVLCYTAANSVIRGQGPEDDNTVERLSRSLLEMGWGRWLLAAGGVTTVAVGLFFVVGKGIVRRFANDLRGVDASPSKNHGVDLLLLASGVVGWIGRGVVTILVGYFVTRSAVRFDPDDARGFDRALREIATTPIGTVLVWASGVGLVLYGAFCLLSHRRRCLEDHS